MKEELKAGDVVIVVNYWDSPQYKGIVVCLTEKSVEVRRLDSWFGKTKLEKIEHVLKTK